LIVFSILLFLDFSIPLFNLGHSCCILLNELLCIFLQTFIIHYPNFNFSFPNECQCLLYFNTQIFILIDNFFNFWDFLYHNVIFRLFLEWLLLKFSVVHLIFLFFIILRILDFFLNISHKNRLTLHRLFPLYTQLSHENLSILLNTDRVCSSALFFISFLLKSQITCIVCCKVLHYQVQLDNLIKCLIHLLLSMFLYFPVYIFKEVNSRINFCSDQGNFSARNDALFTIKATVHLLFHKLKRFSLIHNRLALPFIS
jgi:hypothetical protein